LEHTPETIFELSLVFIVHCDTDHEFWVSAMVMMMPLDSSEHRIAINWSDLSVLEEPTGDKVVSLWVGLDHREHFVVDTACVILDWTAWCS